MSQVVNHLLFHKAMVGVDIDRVDQYIKIADGASSAAEVSTIEDPFTRSVTLLFMLVKEHGLDPWSLDMKHLIMEYQKYALKDDDLDLPLAGSVLGWVGIHRQHHNHFDQDNDPHLAEKGFISLVTMQSYDYVPNAKQVID